MQTFALGSGRKLFEEATPGWFAAAPQNHTPVLPLIPQDVYLGDLGPADLSADRADDGAHITYVAAHCKREAKSRGRH